MADPFINHPRGADLNLDMTWQNEDGTPVDLTGIALVPFEVIPAALESEVVVTITDAEAGEFSVRIPWGDGWPATGIGSFASGPVAFRIQASNGGLLSQNIPVVLT